MKSFTHFLLLAFVAFGCASRGGRGEAGLVLEPIGPEQARAKTQKERGALVVYTAFDPSPHFNSSAYHTYYSDYELRSGQGAILKRVHNDSGSVVEGPVEVALQPGQYQIRAKANGYGWVTVPVVIEPGRVTTVHLEGGRENQHASGQDELVRLPHGEIAGWRATTSLTGHQTASHTGF